MSGAPKKGLSLYADLLGEKRPEKGSTISGAPVKYDAQAREEEGAKKKDASLQFQPIRRPQAAPKTQRPKPTSTSAHKPSVGVATTPFAPSASPPDAHSSSAAKSSTPQLPPAQRSNFEDWVGDEDEGFYYDKPRYERGGKKKKKKKKQGQQETRVWDWDDIYDPTLPNQYADYKGSEEQYREIRDWKARLYYHELKKGRNAGKSAAAYSDEEEQEYARPPANRMFAPPANLNFAPPTFDDGPTHPLPADDDDGDFPPRGPGRRTDTSNSYEPPTSFAPPPAPAPAHAAGDDAYTRRMRLSEQVPAAQPVPPPPAGAPTPPPAAAAAATQKADGPESAPADAAAKKAEALAKIAAFKAKMQAQKAAKADSNGAAASPTPPVQTPVPPTAPAEPAAPITTQAASLPPPPPVEEPGVAVSRAPVRYQLPPSDLPREPDIDEADDASLQAPPAEAEQPRSSRPGQKGFAERLLKKYGWEKGQGLGAQGEGITTAIVAKAEKRKKLPDAQGGGWAQPANMGRIVGGKKRKVDNADGPDEAKLGPMSEVVKLEGMCKGMDLDHEIQENDLFGEIGKEMETQYGKVERLYIWRKEQGGNDDVFVKFTSQLSALRCLNAADGMTFAENEVVAKFFDADNFERGLYE